jgi:hypothetical protein
LEGVILEDIASIGVRQGELDSQNISLEMPMLPSGVFGKECAVVTKERGWVRLGIEKSA